MQNKVSKKRRVFFALAMMVLGVMMFTFPALAAVSAPAVMINLISLMCSMFKFVGVAIFVWAIIQFILATKRSDADSKGDAIQTAVCGIALMAIAMVVNSLGLADAIEGGDQIKDNSLDGGA